ncbi:Radical SAM superfamily protein [Anatilimnocola aggregata]|uniref:Radical SAM superfamily protein n=1 Tax=Anatilimnocola aggregata TaxID=2528021 RepID=A0A517YC32_9BACT|nr:radical SAM protein [Anatilimnocola aggregata]QDU27798.1 Radical SAM superfamily protein [Anatilimnocola aggregata]
MPLDVLHTQHQRRFAESKFVYPVLSRRSGGISLGVNLNPDKVCNFDCIYCQVDRTTQSDTRFVELPRMLDELDHFLTLITSGQLYEFEKFSHTPRHLRRLNDIAFSGDGEPTTHRNFDEIVTAAAALKKQHILDNVKLVLITNASMFHREHVQRGLEVLDQNNGEVWAKLEAGTEAYLKLIDRTPISLRQIVDNIAAAAKIRPLVIQSLFMRVAGEPPTAAEFAAYCDRLNEIIAAGGKLSLIQIYTVARKPTESYVTPLTDAEVDALVSRVQEQTGIPAQAFYGTHTDALQASPSES